MYTAAHNTNNSLLANIQSDLTDEQITQNENIKIIESRFGKITVNYHNAIYFPFGLLGMPDNLHFCLAEIPDHKNNEFKLLQCLNDFQLSFIVLPIGLDNQLIDKKDIEEACNTLDIKIEDTVVMLITIMNKDLESKLSIFVNLRAPIFVDCENKVAAQYVLPNNKYEVRHKLTY